LGYLAWSKSESILCIECMLKCNKSVIEMNMETLQKGALGLKGLKQT